MSTLEKKKQDLQDFRTVRFVSTTLSEISAERIKSLRAEFEKNQRFHVEVSNLYRTVKLNAIRRNEYAEKTSTKKKAIAVAMTSNSRFYGSLNRNIMSVFVADMQERNRDYLVVGNTGRRYMDTVPKHKSCQYLMFKGDQPSDREIQQFLKMVDVYDQVFIYYPMFVNAFTQDVAVLDINHASATEEIQPETVEDIDYIFEPELPKILRFFETRVRHLLFHRVMLEAELSRTAARLVAMQGAEERADDAIDKMRISIRKEKETFDTMRLLESLAGRAQWKKSQTHL